MPRPRNPNRDEAFKLWKKSKGTAKPRDIAAKLGESATQISKWKLADHWEDRLSSKGGAPRGNKNAVGNAGGHGAPLRNTFAETHGAYSKVYFDTLDEDELELLKSIELNEEQILLQQLQDLVIKARRLKRKIKAAEEERGGLSLEGVVRERTPKGEKTTTITTNVFDRIIKLESELDKTQGRITEVTKTIMKYRSEREHLTIEKKKLQLFEQRALGIIDIGFDDLSDDDAIDVGDDDDGEGGAE